MAQRALCVRSSGVRPVALMSHKPKPPPVVQRQPVSAAAAAAWVAPQDAWPLSAELGPPKTWAEVVTDSIIAMWVAPSR